MSSQGKDDAKAPSIPMRRLGGSGLYVSELGLGAMTFSTDGKSSTH
jgi:aryl-alcohol dehydrogenase-like predicted oxidoreductase